MKVSHFSNALIKMPNIFIDLTESITRLLATKLTDGVTIQSFKDYTTFQQCQANQSVSSALRKIETELLRHLYLHQSLKHSETTLHGCAMISKSLIYMLNSIGPKMLP